MPSSQILPIHRMTDIESQGDETDYGNKTICFYGKNNKFTDNQ